MPVKKSHIPTSKGEFINILMAMTPSELNEYIKEKSKPPKRIYAFNKIHYIFTKMEEKKNE